MNQIQMRGIWRDYWGRWDAKAGEQIALLNDPERFRPSYYSVPSRDVQSVVAGGYAQAQISITPGSFIWGIDYFTITRRFSVQITDLSLGHAWFNMPTPNLCFTGRVMPLPEPYPVVYPGLFRAEFWNTAAVTQNCELILCVAEYTGHEQNANKSAA